MKIHREKKECYNLNSRSKSGYKTEESLNDLAICYLVAPRKDEQPKFADNILVADIEVGLQRCTVEPSVEL